MQSRKLLSLILALFMMLTPLTAALADEEAAAPVL